MVATKNNRWGDLLEEEEELPAPTTSGPDAKGLVTKVEYYRNDKGEVMKRTIKTRTVKIEKRVYPVRPPAANRPRRTRQLNWRRRVVVASQRPRR